MARLHEGRSVIITGSTSGIGLGIARAFAHEGANITLNGFGDAEVIEKIRAGMETEFGVKVRYSHADMSKPVEISALVGGTVSALGRCDILVNNAGIQHVAPVDEFPIEKWDAIVAINLSSVFHATRAALPHMKAAKWGRVINIASAHGLVASPYKSAYVAAKHGVVGFTKSCALEVAEQGITVNAICPGYVLTPLVEKQIDDQAKVHGIPRENVIRDILLAPQPNKRFAEIDEVASLALYLASNAAQGITGTSMSIDGGWTAR
jgi:3-hydroxybutyrate dehydrogenase